MRELDTMYSHIVGWVKILLPLAALALLSTLFLVPRPQSQPDAALVANVARIAQEQRVMTPEFSGVTGTGAIVKLSARKATPHPELANTIFVQEMRLNIDRPDGSTLDVTAVEGEFDAGTREARFLGLARLSTSNGYEMETQGLRVLLDTGEVLSDGQLEIQTPFGRMTAGQVAFSNPEQAGQAQMLFHNGVRLIYIAQE